MDSFFSCFGFRDDDFHSQTRLFAQKICSKKTREDGKALLSWLFQSKEQEDYVQKNEESHGLGSSRPNDAEWELKDEAKFLKACGAIMETPTEIRNAVQKFKRSPTPHGEPSTFRSWLPNSSIQKIQWDVQPEPSASSSKLSEEWENEAESSKHSPSSCISNSQTSDNTATPVSPATNVQCSKKSVSFECAMDDAFVSPNSSSYKSVSQNLKKLEFSSHLGMSNPSPYATPLELSDEMQTPGTYFPSNPDHTQERNPRIRSQYVYSALNSIAEFSHCKNDLNEEVSKQVESFDKPMNPVPSIEVVSMVNPCFGGTPGDRPILGTDAAHWIENDINISPKTWDGNGIPNTTTKYKEDQKVSWHATPFVVRLEKALSEETSVSQRKDLKVTVISLDNTEQNAIDA